MSQRGLEMLAGPNGTKVQDNAFQSMFQGVVINVSYTGTAGTSAAFGASTTLIRLCSTSDCYYLISTAGTAATSSNGSLLPAGVVEFPSVLPLQKISVVQSSASGTLNITQGA